MPPKRRVKRQEQSNIDEDDVVLEHDVFICQDLPHTELYRIQFPTRKKKTFHVDAKPRLRYKKNVKMMEMRLAADTNSASFDKSKFNVMTANQQVKPEPVGQCKSDEIYEGRSFSDYNPLQYAMGFFKDEKFYICPISGTFNMQRSITNINSKFKGKEEDGNITEESDTENTGGSQPLRIKFSRPETERQKKRREASALHREKLIASDHWINMDVYLDDTSTVNGKWDELSNSPDTTYAERPTLDMREIVQRAIICGKLDQLDLTNTDQQMSHQRIRELPPHLQIKAQVIKARAIRTDTLAHLIYPEIPTSELYEGLSKCAHLVCGVWVLKSEFLFNNLPPAHAVSTGKIDEARSEVWREARDLALALLNSGHKVNRTTLSKCFLLNVGCADQILSTFGVKGDKTWKLKIDTDQTFLNNPENMELILRENQYWVDRFNHLQTRIDRSASPKRVRRRSGRGSPQKEAN
ncbi:unnamed protein product [Auanema sp. JU1783]|nr:unnamed protein product [Auanema sp. JU1783]